MIAEADNDPEHAKDFKAAYSKVILGFLFTHDS